MSACVCVYAMPYIWICNASLCSEAERAVNNNQGRVYDDDELLYGKVRNSDGILPINSLGNSYCLLVLLVSVFTLFTVIHISYRVICCLCVCEVDAILAKADPLDVLVDSKLAYSVQRYVDKVETYAIHE